MSKAMRTYFMKYRFTHPTKKDFLDTIEEVSGKKLDWYFNQAVYGSPVLDYEVGAVDSFPVNWYEDEKKDKDKDKDKKNKKNAKDDTVYQTYVSLRRVEDFVMPVVVEIKFDNGETIREHWNGESRWIRYSYQKKAKAVSAEIDPDHTVQIDRNNFNNSYVVKADSKPTNKVSTYWLFVSQWLAQALAWWAV